MSIIIIGIVVDLIGSKALFSMCITPLAFKVSYKDCVQRGICAYTFKPKVVAPAGTIIVIDTLSKI